MATATEIAQLYYTLGARVDPQSKQVTDSEIASLEELQEVADETGIPIGQLRALVAELVEGLDPAAIAAEALAEALEAVAQASGEGIDALSQQVRLYAQGAQIDSTRAASMARLAEIETLIRKRLEEGNVTLQQRIRLTQVLAQVQTGQAAGAARAVAASSATTAAVQAGTIAVQQHGDQWKRATLQVAAAAGSIVQSGNLSAGSLKGILLGATSLVGVIGGGGALVAAAAIGAQAIIALFTRARDEARRTTDEMLEEIQRLQNAGAFTELQDKLQNIWTGTAAKNFEDGLGFIRGKLADLNADLELAPTIAEGFGIARRIEELKAQEQPLAEAFARIRKIIMESPVPRAPARRTAIEVESPRLDDGRAGQAKAAQFRDVAQSVDDLIASVTASNDPLADFNRRFREIEDAFKKIKNPTQDMVAQFEDFTTKVAAARDTLSSLSAQQAAKELRDLMASMTTTVVDDLTNQLDDLQQKLTDFDAPPEQAQAILAIQLARIQNAREEEAVASRIAEIEKTKISAFDAQLALQDELQRIQEETSAITGKDEASLQRIASKNKQIAALKTEITRLSQEAGEAVEAEVSAGTKLLSTMQEVASVALGIATATLGIEHGITKAIGGAQQLLGAFTQISELATKAGGFSKLFSSGAGIASALPALGAAIGGAGAIAGVFTAKSPEEEERLRILKVNNQRLADLTLSLDKSIAFSAGGAAAATVRDLDLSKLFDVVVKRAGAQAYQVPSAKKALEELKALGVGIDELRKIAADAGIELSDVPTFEQLEQLQAFLKSRSLEGLFEGIKGQLRKLELEAKLDPDAFKGLEGVMARIRLLTGPDGVPAIAEALAGIDLSTEEGLIAAVEALRELGLNLDDIDFSKLGDLNPDELLAEIVRLVEGIRENSAAAKSAVDAFLDAMGALGVQFDLGTGDLLGRARDQLAKTIEGFKTAFPEFADADFSNADAFKASIQTFIDSLDDDGLITEAEQKVIDAVKVLLGAFGTAAAAEAEKRRDILAAAEEIIDLGDVEDPIEQLRLRAKAFAEAFGEFVDVPAEGLDKLNPEELTAFIQETIAALHAMGEGATVAGIPIEEIIAALLGLEAGADAAAAAVTSLAAQLAAAFADIDKDLEIAGVTDPVEKLVRKADAAGAIDARIKAALGDADLRDANQRKAVEERLKALGASSDDEALRDAIIALLRDIRSITPPDATSLGGASKEKEQGTTTRGAVSVGTERSQQILVDLTEAGFRQRNVMIDLLREIAAHAPVTAPVLSPLVNPFGGGAVVFEVDARTVFQGPVTVTDAKALGALVSGVRKDEAHDIVDQLLGSGARQYLRFRGDA